MLKREGTVNKIAVMQAYVDGKTIQFAARDACEWNDIVDNDTPIWDWAACNYRIKPVEKPCIDWAAIPDKFKWLAVDKNGRAFIYSDEPKAKLAEWLSNNVARRVDETHASYKRGNCDWQDSLIKRGDV